MATRVQARIKTVSEYHWFKFAGKRPVQVTHGNGKTSTSIEPGDAYGLRPSSDGKKFRLVTQKTGLTKVFTVSETTYKSLVKYGHVSNVRKVDYKVAACLDDVSKQLKNHGIEHIIVAAFGKKAAVETPDGWEPALDKFVDGVQKIYDKYIHDNEFTLQYGSKIVSEDATKYTKVFIQEPHGNKRIYCFIDRATGDILKPATYTVPAKGARGSLFDEYNGLKRMGPHGPAYNK